MIRLRTQTPEDLAQLVQALVGVGPSYPEVGASADDQLPPGYRHDRYEREVGTAADFALAAEGLRHWVPHKGAGAQVVPDQPVRLGSTVLILLRIGPVRMIAPCRIVGVVDTDEAFGFTYGTLPGHPEQGEESFVVERQAEVTVFRIVAFSRPAEPLARLSGPVGRLVQRTVTERYLQSLARHVQTAR